MHDLVSLGIIFILLLVLMARRVPLYLSMALGILLGFVLFRLNFREIGEILRKGALSRSTLYLVLAFYSITFLQRMLEKRNHLQLAEHSLTRLFGSRRINATLAPFTIGLLPSVGAVLIARPIVDNAAGDSLTIEERCFVTSFYRHISEAFLPTYATIILAIELSGVSMPGFVFAMLPVVFLLFFLGFVFYVRKIPKTKSLGGVNKKEEVKNLFISLWAIGASIVLILSLGIPVHYAVIPVILLSILVNGFSLEELRPMVLSAFETKLILTTFAIMIFKEMLVFTGVIDQLPELFQSFPLHPVIIFGLIFFLGSILAGTQAMVAMMLPVVTTSLGSHLGLLVFIMSITFIASQVSITHICLGVICEDYGLPFTSLVRKTLPVMISFILLSSAYSYLLYLLF